VRSCFRVVSGDAMVSGRFRTGIFAGLLLGCIGQAAPSFAIEIFGFKFLEPEPPDAVEMIDPVRYTVSLRAGQDDGEIAKAVRAASTLIRDADRPASGRAGLLAHANGDYARIIDALYGMGYFGPRVSILIDGREAANLPLDAELTDAPRVVVDVAPGRLYRFGTVSLTGAPQGYDAAADGFVRGGVATSGIVRGTARKAVRLWQEQSHALAEVSDTSIVADHATATLDVALTVKAGPPVTYGPTTVLGTKAVDHAFVEYIANLPRGRPFHPDDVRNAQRRLVKLDTFRAVDIETPEELSPDGTLPVSIGVTSRKPRRFGFGATLSSVDGLGIEGFWLHRNLFRRAERLRFDGSVSGIGRSTDPTDYDYAASVSFLKPGVFTPETEFRLRFGAAEEKRPGFTSLSLETSGSFATNLSDNWSAETGLVLERSRIDDNFGRRRFSILTWLNVLTYEGRDVPLDAKEGYYLQASVDPFVVDNSSQTAVRATLEARTYRALDEDAKYVLAGRAKIGTVEGLSAASTPPQNLFYTGGGGSVRGFEYLANGVTVGGVTTGGQSLVELSGELRVDFDESLGGVAFVDAGHVGAGGFPDLSNSWKVGAGVGIRFNTGLGPLRIDVARALTKSAGDPNFALYIGLGQAF